ncbi:MAG: hypothetical protein V7754_08985 [Halioglobus sp.]
MSNQGFLDVASAEAPGSRQRVFMRYFTAILIDLVVINIYAEHWHMVALSSFSVSLAVALLLQVLLTITLKIEYRVAAFFNAKEGSAARFLRFFSAWLILFVSKLIILGVIDFTFGDQIRFLGQWHGVVPFIVVIVTMLVAEELVARVYRRLGD